LQDVVRFRLAHQFADQIRANVGIGLAECPLELVESHLHVPQKIWMALVVDQEVARCGCDHGSSVREIGGGVLNPW
jgi:hypothetical protein